MILKKGVPEVVAMVRSGGMALNEAEQIVEMKRERQREIAKRPKVERHAQLRKSNNKAQGHKRSAAAFKRTQADIDNVPGTPLVRAMLTRLELAAEEVARHNMTPEQYAAAFVQQFDWGHGKLAARMARALPVVRMFGSLAMLAQQARNAA